MSDWETRWREGNTPWDAGGPSPSIVTLASELPLGRALVAGCGSGHDVFALANSERHVTGLDIAESVRPIFEETRDAAGVTDLEANLEVGDFFAHVPPEPYDLIWDYTFLCAIDPSERERWAAKIDSLLAPDGVFASLVFPVIHVDESYQGPPWPLDPEGVAELLKPHGFVATTLEPAAVSVPARAGKEWIGVFSRV